MAEVRPDGDEEREARLDEIIAGYIKDLESGEPPDPAQTLAAHPEFEEELREFFQGEDLMARLCPKAETAETSRSPPCLPPAGPRSFGDFELLEELARGGMGVVYRARQMSVGRIVALKMIRSAVLASPEEHLRFQIEAQSAASLDHPGIVPLYEVGELEGQPYFSMKYIEGGNLADHSEFLGRDHDASARLMEAVARAVHYAHTRGVLHRDLKPANILIDRDGNPYVSDFGLAKRIEDDRSLTLSGTVLGTPSYMSPEQAAGKTKSVTTASDVYSIGAILYELLARRPAFRGKSSLETLEKVIREEPARPSEIEPGVPRDLETICLKCLEKEPRARYATAAELADDLRRYLDREPISARPASAWQRLAKWVRRRPAAAAAAAVSALAVAAILGVSLGYNFDLKRQAQEIRAQDLVTRRHVHATRMNMAFEELKAGSIGRVMDLLKSLIPPPGSEDLRGFEWYHLWRLCNGDLYTLRGHEDTVLRVAFSPDSQLLATAGHDGAVKLWRVRTGQEIAELRGPSIHVDALAYSPDGKTIATAQEDFLVRLWDVPTRKVRLVLRGHRGTVGWAAFSPEGDVLATASGDRTVRLWDPSSGIELGKVGSHDNTVHSVQFSRDGKWIATATQDAIVNLHDRKTGEVRFSENLHSGPTLCLSFLADSKILAVGCWDGVVKFFDVPGGNKRRQAQVSRKPVCALDSDPRSSMIVAAGGDQIVNLLDGENGVILYTFVGHPRGINAAAWSPDDRWIATGGNDGTAKIWDALSTGEPGSFDNHTDVVQAVSISRDGKMLFSGSKDGVLISAALDSRGTGPPLVEKALIDLRGSIVPPYRLSPDGTYVSFIGKAKAVEVWSIDWEEKRAAPARVEPPGAPATAVAFLPGSTGLAASMADGSLVTWNHIAPGHGAIADDAIAEGASADGTSAGGASREGGAWRKSTHEPLPVEDVSFLEISPDGRWLAMARDEAPAVFVQERASGMTRGNSETLKGHARAVVSLAFSSDSRLLATGSLDLTARLWKLEPRPGGGEWREWKTLHGHTKAVGALAFSPDGKVLATGSDDKTVRLWDFITGEMRANLSAHDGQVEALLFTPHGDTMISAGGKPQNGEIRVWRTATDDDVARRL